MAGGQAGLEEVFRERWGRILAILARQFGDLEVAEEAAQEAFAIAAETWPRGGTPHSPEAWLLTTARNRAINRLRRERTLTGKLASLAASNASSPDATEDEAMRREEPEIPDERLELMFTCCHPALSLEAQVALTLRTVAGLSTARLAEAFLVPEATMAQRLVRAKRKIRVAGIPFGAPAGELVAARLSAVLAVVYLIYNAGFLDGAELAGEAIRLGRLLVRLVPADAEVHGLLALLALQESRRAARSAGGELVLLDAQDRSLWDRELIAEGRAALARAVRLADGEAGPYLVQAEIAALQLDEPRDVTRIAERYAELSRLTGSPVVRLNQAIAVAETGAVQRGLELLEEVELEELHYLHAARAELLRRLGRPRASREALERALATVRDERERRLLEARLSALDI